ncbi:hypothetical protein RF55_12116 [Lasius niger]|uniref:SAP domain-containing protein n=1 Tax=Lasius niger TaxID=67767 RepID=A0A0J7N6U3_LASNI|nr:hypothetical protein RF55_12116 [Lasius niger]
MSDPSVFNVLQLKEFLRARGLSVTGAKNELIACLMEADPSGEWMMEQNEDDIGSDVRRENPVRQREIEIYRREKEIAERELELARREIALLRERQNTNFVDRERQEETIVNNDDGVRRVSPHTRLNLTAIADLLANFDGISSDFDTWERQVRLLKMTYQLEDDHAKILVGMRLKKKVLEWFHSKPEFISMSFNALINELKLMFRHRQNRVTTRKMFEARIWKKDETFHEYVYEKVIMGNLIPIEADEMIDYIIDGIPDSVLRNQARIQRFTETESLLEAFETISLRDCHVTGSNRPDKRGSKSTVSERDNDTDRSEKKDTSGEKKKMSEGLTARLKKAQNKDDDVKKILDTLKQGQPSDYILRGGLLYKEIDDDIRLVIPKSMQIQIIRRAHERGHFAVGKTEALVKKDYWIPKLRPKVETIVRNCIAFIWLSGSKGCKKIIRVLRNNRYLVHKIGEHEGPSQTSTASDFMKPWINSNDDILEDDSENEADEHSK